MTNVVAAFILHLVPGKLLLAIGLSCYAIAALLGAAQPLNTIYWAMSFPAMSNSPCYSRVIVVIGVIGADVTYLVTSLFAATSVSESQQSIASGIVATTAAVCGSIYNAVAAALISGNSDLVNIFLSIGIGGNAIQEANPDRAQLIKGFQAQFWFSFGSATLAALGALTLKIGRRGTHDEIREARRADQERETVADIQSEDRVAGSEQGISEK
jgi:hypothetical protein